MLTDKLLMIVFIAAASFAAKRAKALTASGAITAFIVGSSVYYGFGMKGFILLGSFFVTSSLWSEFKKSKKTVIEEKLAKGSTRDWLQVLANGGTAAILGIIYYLSNQSMWAVAFAVAVSSATSDTWASEVGSLSKKNPIDIRTLRRADKGTSGAISLLGSIAALAGSLLIALLSCLLFDFNLMYTLLVFFFGFVGNLIDTFMGAFLQLKFLCRHCGVETEKKVHCGEKTIRIKGKRFIDNDMVNFLSGFIAALLVIAVIQLVK